MFIKRSFFGLETLGSAASRVVGEVHADFIPLTSDRSDFIRDTPEHLAFQEVMQKTILQIRASLERMLNIKESRRAKRVLGDVLERVKQALIHNPDYCPDGLLPVGEEETQHGPPASIVSAADKKDPEFRKESQKPAATTGAEKKTRKKRPQVKRLTPSAVIKRLKLGQQGLSCCMDDLGAENPECYTEGTVVYINRDHPLHKRFARDKRTYELYIARLLTQEIALMRQPRSPRQAFQRQSKLLRDALAA